MEVTNVAARDGGTVLIITSRPLTRLLAHVPGCRIPGMQ